jgi:glycogen synthase
MRILMLSWEYPPRVVGGLGRHVGALARDLAAQGHEVHVVTRATADDAGRAVNREAWCSGVHVVRVVAAPEALGADDLVAWVLATNTVLQAAAGRILRERDIDVVHAHDWLVAHAAVGLQHTWDVPVVATVHATERGRHQGWLPGPMNVVIDEVERWLTGEAGRVITCSRYMREQVRRSFDLPRAKLDVVPNGVDVAAFEVDEEQARVTRATLTGPRTKLILFAGRLEYEKGVQTVLRALDRVRQRVGPTRFVVAGEGTYGPELRREVRRLGLRRHVRFTGFLDDDALRHHYAAADVAVAPSIYEPFGLVAVEAMASGTPVVVSDTGGLREVVDGPCGLRTAPEDPEAPAAALVRVLDDAELAQRLAAGGRARVRSGFAWGTVASRTVEVYRRAVDEHVASQAAPPARFVARDLDAAG